MVWLTVSSMQANGRQFKGIEPLEFRKALVGDMKKQHVKQVTFCLLFLYSISPFHYDNALLMTVQSFPIDLQPIKHLDASSISNLTMFVCMFTHCITFSFFTSHLVIHHGYTSLLFDTAALWLLIRLYVYMNSQLLGPLGEPTGKPFYVTVRPYIWYA